MVSASSVGRTLTLLSDTLSPLSETESTNLSGPALLLGSWGPFVIPETSRVSFQLDTGHQKLVAHSCNPSYSGGRDQED
jgi:hypothetical protein